MLKATHKKPQSGKSLSRASKPQLSACESNMISFKLQHLAFSQWNLLVKTSIISCTILDNQVWTQNVRQQAQSITCRTATPTATPATGTKLASTHSSPARRHPRSKMLRSPGWEEKISLSTNYNQPPSQHAARKSSCKIMSPTNTFPENTLL